MDDRLMTRMRRTDGLRRMMRENHLRMDELIYPIFIIDGNNIKREISSMKEQYHLTVDLLEGEVEKWRSKGIGHLILFGVPDTKDEEGTGGFEEDGLIQKALRKLKEVAPEMTLITDVCLCEYKEDGHCCFYHENGTIDRDRTLNRLSEIALSHVRAGADMVAPSDMMDKRIQHIRRTLDEAGYEHIPIMAYSAKYASAFYGPFREAAHSAPSFGDRKSYQMDPANGSEAVLEAGLDYVEGADIIMVKPAMMYLDVISRLNNEYELPVAAYQVSGEYVMLYDAVENCVLDEKAIYESLVSIKRSGAKLIITYWAPRMKEYIEKYQE